MGYMRLPAANKNCKRSTKTNKKNPTKIKQKYKEEIQFFIVNIMK